VRRRVLASLLTLSTVSWITTATPVRAEAVVWRVRVWVAADTPGVMLERRPSKADSSWTTICEAPCGKSFDPGWEYRLNGDGIVPSQPLDLSSQGPEVTLRTATVSQARRTGGIVLLPIGAITAIAGTWLGIRAAQGDANSGARSTGGAAAGYFLLGAAGVGVFALGVLLVTARTSVEFQWGPPAKVPLVSGAWLTPQGIVF
jgi:hypothetical protein